MRVKIALLLVVICTFFGSAGTVSAQDEYHFVRVHPEGEPREITTSDSVVCDGRRLSIDRQTTISADLKRTMTILFKVDGVVFDNENLEEARAAFRSYPVALVVDMGCVHPPVEGPVQFAVFIRYRWRMADPRKDVEPMHYCGNVELHIAPEKGALSKRSSHPAYRVEVGGGQPPRQLCI